MKTLLTSVFALLLASCGQESPPPPGTAPVAIAAPKPADAKPAEAATPASPAATPPAPPLGPAAGNGPGTLKGKITFGGPASNHPPIQIGGQPAAQGCGQNMIADESLIVGEGGGLKNAVVLIMNVPGGAPPANAQMALFDQKGCVFSPHVLAVQKNAQVQLKNGDQVAHNVNVTAFKNASFNDLITAGMSKVVTFAEPEKIAVACNIHGWMKGYIVVHDSPFFAVTDEKGEFSITGVPAGTYDVRVWHESAGQEKKSVTIPAGGAAELNVALK